MKNKERIIMGEAIKRGYKKEGNGHINITYLYQTNKIIEHISTCVALASSF